VVATTAGWLPTSMLATTLWAQATATLTAPLGSADLRSSSLHHFSAPLLSVARTSLLLR